MSAEFYDCTACGAGMGIAGSSDTGSWSEDDWAAQQHFEDEIRYHESRQCRRDRRERTKTRRAAAREAAVARVASLRDWREDRRVAARKRAADRLNTEPVPRGVDRVPAQLHFVRTKPLPDPVIAELGTYRGVQAPYRDRRAMGQRGHRRPPRRREMPGAMQRRIKRNQQSWT